MSKAKKNKFTNSLRFVHITDTHLLNQPNATFNNIYTKESLEAILSHIQNQYSEIDFVLITGDVSQTGDPDSYEILKTIVQGYKFPIYCIPGNHDSPKCLQQVIPTSPVNNIHVIEFGCYSLVLINSCLENQHKGKISQQCLQQLNNHLRKHSKQFNIFAVHHPPVLINSKWLDELGLINKSEFIQLITQNSMDSVLLCGHVHQEIDQQIGKVRILSTPSTCYQFEANAENMRCIPSPQPAYRVVKLFSNTINTCIYYL